eukprot:SAG22_NODE_6096_length_899_cov_0.942500_1_plen_87_part_10
MVARSTHKAGLAGIASTALALPHAGRTDRAAGIPAASDAPPDWPAAVHFTGNTTTTISTATPGGPPLPAVAEHGSISYWSSCSASEP